MKRLITNEARQPIQVSKIINEDDENLYVEFYDPEKYENHLCLWAYGPTEVH